MSCRICRFVAACRLRTWRRGRIRTRGAGCPARRFSKPVVSATHPTSPILWMRAADFQQTRSKSKSKMRNYQNKIGFFSSAGFFCIPFRGRTARRKDDRIPCADRYGGVLRRSATVWAGQGIHSTMPVSGCTPPLGEGVEVRTPSRSTAT